MNNLLPKTLLLDMQENGYHVGISARANPHVLQSILQQTKVFYLFCNEGMETAIMVIHDTQSGEVDISPEAPLGMLVAGFLGITGWVEIIHVDNMEKYNAN
jgi:hypothetical protein